MPAAKTQPPSATMAIAKAIAGIATSTRAPRSERRLRRAAPRRARGSRRPRPRSGAGASRELLEAGLERGRAEKSGHSSSRNTSSE